jgi:C-terminal processing protease CtpA/Prc
MTKIRSLVFAAVITAGCSGAPRPSSDPAAARAIATIGDSDGNGVPVTAFTPTYSTLETRRSFIQWPTYSPDQRQKVANEAQLLFHELYVHRDEKVSFYGPLVDPVPHVDWLAANAKTLPDDLFHTTLQAIFESVRDLHQNYYFPYPYACYSSQLPLTFVAIADPSNPSLPAITVNSLLLKPEVLALVPQLTQIAVGDVLTSYDGLPTALAVAALMPFSNGANWSGAFERAVQQLSLRSQVSYLVPANNTLRMTLQRQDGSRYDIEMPWLSVVRAVCKNGVPQSALATADLSVDSATDDYQVEYQQTYALPQQQAAALGLTASAEPILSYGKINAGANTFGYILLTSFSPVVLTVDQTVDEFARILRDELKDTAGLIIDVRDNGGGQIGLADQLPQLLSANQVVSNGFRFINTDTNAMLVHGPQFEGTVWQTLIDDVRGTSARFTATAPMTDELVTNSRTQVYFKPVAVLTNAKCFSSCDMFTASMQDNGLAQIWGEDFTTGAGGANVITDATFRSFLPDGPNNPFPVLPNGQVMRDAWRQTVRVGSHAGQLIEDYGVLRDQDGTKTMNDVLHPSASQLGRITTALAALSSAARGSVYMQTSGVLDVGVGAPVGFDATVADTDGIDVVVDGKIVAHQSLALGPAQLVHINVAPMTELGLYRVELRGLRAGVRVWRAFATVRVVPPYAPLPAGGLSLDFSSGSAAPLAIYTQYVPLADGWHVQNGKLTTTRGTHYVDNTDSDAVLFVDLTARTSVSLKLHAKVQTEDTFDFFNIYTVVDGKRTLIDSLTGEAERDLSYDLSALAGHQAQIDFEFTSDTGVTAAGVYLDHISLQ